MALEHELPAPPPPTSSALHQHLNGKAITSYSIASFGAGLFYGFNNATLPLLLNHFTNNPLLIGLLSSTRSIEGSILQPFIGAWSDRTWTPLGRRRPFMAIGIPLSALGFIMAAFTSNLLTLSIAIVFFSLLFNAAIAPFNALLADLFAIEHRSTVNAIATFVQFIGTIAIIFGGALLSGHHLLRVTPVIVAIGMLLTFIVTMLTIHEPHQLEAPTTSPTTITPSLRLYLQHLLTNWTAFRYLLVLFSYNFGSNAILPYLTLFAVHILHASAQIAQLLFLGLVLATAVFLLPFGLAARRYGRRPVLAAGMTLLAITALLGLLIQTVPQILIVILLAGVGNAAITATSWPLLTELITPGETGVYAGLLTACESIALPLSVFVSSTLIRIWSYRAIFIVLTIGAICALLFLRTISRPAIRAQHTP